MYVSLCLAAVEQFMRVRIWSRLVDENPFIYLKTIILPAFTVMATSYILSYLFSSLVSIHSPFLSVLVIGGVSFIIGTSLIYIIGLNSDERNRIRVMIISKIHK